MICNPLNTEEALQENVAITLSNLRDETGRRIQFYMPLEFIKQVGADLWEMGYRKVEA